MVRTTAEGPPLHLEEPSIWLDAVGIWNTGPAPQMSLPGLAGEKKSVSWRLAMPPMGEPSP